VKTKHLIVGALIIATAVVEFTVLRKVDIRAEVPAGIPTATGTASAATPPPAYDMTALRAPAKDYLGVALKGGVGDLSLYNTFAGRIGKKPNLITIYESFDDGFAASQVRAAHSAGAMVVLRWEPFDVPLKDIAAGKHDGYVSTFAQAVRRLNLPIVLTFAHEMNGNWYSWGPQKTKAADFIAAWRHVHDIFGQQDATNVIWTWTANVINPVPRVKLQPLYPGDAYVDWLGVDGYFTLKGQRSFDTLFGPTIRQMRAFSTKPLLIVETGAEPQLTRSTQVTDLLNTVAKRRDILGAVYFNINGSGKWNIDADKSTLAAFRKQAASDVFGFDIRKAS
jgi:mannan endo-1,4-beta-mannosidase